MSYELERLLTQALKEIEALRHENEHLRQLLSKYSELHEVKPPDQINEPEQTPKGRVHLKSSPEEKITLFRSLFRGIP